MPRSRYVRYGDRFDGGDSDPDESADEHSSANMGRRGRRRAWDAYRVTMVALLSLFYVTFLAAAIFAAVAAKNAAASAQTYSSYVDQAFDRLHDAERALDQYIAVLGNEAVPIREDDLLYRLGSALLGAEARASSGSAEKRDATQANVRAALYKYTVGFIGRVYRLVDDSVAVMEEGAPSVERVTALFDRVTRVANETLSGASQEVPRLSNMLHRVMDTLERNHGLSMTIPLMSDQHTEGQKRASAP